MAVGQQLVNPESGWKRYDDKDPNIQYIGTWSDYVDASYWNSSAKRTSTLNDSVKIIFKSTKIRIISHNWSDCSTNIEIKLDGVVVANYNASTSNTLDVVIYENLSLLNTYHTIELKNLASGKYMYLDAIDIDANGWLGYVNKILILSSIDNEIKTVDSSNYIVKSIPYQTEQDFLNYGMNSLSVVDPKINLTKKSYIRNQYNVLGSGKTFTQQIDLTRYKVNKISFQ